MYTWLLTLFAATPLLSGAAFRASAARIDITPSTPQWLLGYGPRQSTGVHDRIWHRVIAMDDGRTQFYLASSDLCLYSPELYDGVGGELQRRFGSGRRQSWGGGTDTHAGRAAG